MSEVISHVTVRPDSLELGTPGRNGCVKLYLDFGDPEECERRIRAAFKLRALAQQLASEQAAA